MKVAFTTLVYTKNYIAYINLNYHLIKNVLKLNVDYIPFVTDNVPNACLKFITCPYRHVKYNSFSDICKNISYSNNYDGTINKFYWASLKDEYDFIIQIDADFITAPQLSDNGILSLINACKDYNIVAVKCRIAPDTYLDEMAGGFYAVNLKKFNKTFEDILEILSRHKCTTDQEAMSILFTDDIYITTNNSEIMRHACCFHDDSMLRLLNDNIYLSNALVNLSNDSIFNEIIKIFGFIELAGHELDRIGREWKDIKHVPMSKINYLGDGD